MTLVWRRRYDRLLCVRARARLIALYVYYDYLAYQAELCAARASCILVQLLLEDSRCSSFRSQPFASLPGRFNFGEMAPGTG